MSRSIDLFHEWFEVMCVYGRYLVVAYHFSCMDVCSRIVLSHHHTKTPQQVYPLLIFPIAIFHHEHEGFLRNPKNLIPGTKKQVRPAEVAGWLAGSKAPTWTDDGR